MANLEIKGSALARNALLNFLGQGILVLIGIVTIPVIIRGLGIDRFGLLSLAWVVLGYFTAFDLGMGRATTKYIAEALGKGNEGQVPELLWTAVSIQGIFGLVGALLLCMITPFLVNRFLNIPPELTAEARNTFYMLAPAIPVALISSSFSGVLEALQRFNLVNAVRVPSSALTFLLPLAGLGLGLGLPGIVALLLVARFIALLFLLAIDLRVLPQIRKFSASFTIFYHLFAFGGWITVSGIIGPVLVYLDRVLIGSLLTIAAVTFYTAPYEAVTRLWVIPVSLTLTLFPAFSTLEGSGDRHRIGVIFGRSIKYTLLALGPITVLLVLFAKEALQIWLGGDFSRASSTVLQFLTVGVLMNSLAQVSYALVQGVGRPDLTAKFHLLELPIYIAVAWFSIRHWGIAGAGAAWTFRVTLDAILLFLATFKICRFPPGLLTTRDLKLSILALSLLAGIAFGTKILAEGLPLSIQIFLFAAILALFSRVLWKNLLDESDRGMIFKMIRRSPGSEKIL